MTDGLSPVRQQQIADMIEALRSTDAHERAFAASWLGEAAAGDAVEPLVHIFLNDEDRRVRAAAGYALGQFRAIDQAIATGKEAKVVKLLTRVEMQGKLGGRVPRGRWVKAIIALLLSLLVLLVSALALPQGQLAGLLPGTVATVDLQQQSAIAASMRPSFVMVRDNLNTLQTQFQTLLGGGTFDCAAYYDTAMQPMRMSAEDAQALPEMAQAADLLNDMLLREASAREQFNSMCFGGQPMTAASIGPVYADIVPAIQALPALDALLAAAQAAAPAATATTVPADGAPTAVATTAIEIIDPQRVMDDLQAIVSLVSLSNSRGPAAVLAQYWNDVRMSGQTGGCMDTVTLRQIPPDFVITPGLQTASQVLYEAAGLTNAGLALLRERWAAFGTACTAGQLSSVANSEAELLQGLQGQLDAATALLNQLRTP
jgi:hypothetical protein